MGSWNTMEMRRPRTLRMADASSVRRSRPSSHTRPEHCAPSGRMPSTERASMVFPLPDSPTSAVVAPRRSTSDTPRTACTAPAAVGSEVRRSSSTSTSSGAGGHDGTDDGSDDRSAARWSAAARRGRRTAATPW